MAGAAGAAPATTQPAAGGPARGGSAGGVGPAPGAGSSAAAEAAAPRPAGRDIPPRRKAAILMISLGPELAARVFRYLREDEIEQLTLEIANTDRVSPEQRQAVLEECRDLALAHAYVAQGGIDYAR
ncbi:MAG TPA: hypothetical protein VIL40_03920, partial [Thermaerobacter sp.]